MRHAANIRTSIARRVRHAPVRSYNFASTQYVSCFGEHPAVDTSTLRANTLLYLAAFDTSSWYNDPVKTFVNGKTHGGTEVNTVDAFGEVNGKQLLGSSELVDEVISHIAGLSRARTDLREQIRRIEAKLLSEHAAALIGNQALDFQKQDGVTEIEESLEANPVEQRLNDLLFQDEASGKVAISREPAFVGAVSNFSNFLDLCRKTLRNLELGVPVVVLSRSNTGQHVYRWSRLLAECLEAEGVDSAMFTFVSCDIEQQRRIMAACPKSPLYFTGSRPVAAAIKELLPNTFASTGGPNTMVATEMTPAVEQATRWSMMIENSGQCTAMRHLVAPGMSAKSTEALFDSAELVSSPEESLQSGGFAGLFAHTAPSFKAADGYTTHPDAPIAFRVASDLPAAGVEEHWRQVYLDVTTPPSAAELQSEAYVSELSSWLTTEQPITLAVNGDDPSADYPLAMRLFEQTAQVVYSVGTPDSPALTCQARPQDGEVFGEFPPRQQLSTYTKFPTIVPSSTPGYMTEYTLAFLEQQAAAQSISEACQALGSISNGAMKGYINTLAEYLVDACGPKRGGTGRTALWGLQRPPLNGKASVLRCAGNATLDNVLMFASPFYLTNARDQLAVSVHPEAEVVAKSLESIGIQVQRQSEEEFEASVSSTQPWNILHATAAPALGFPLVDKLVSVVFPVGHIKSTAQHDEVFVNAFMKSKKWLQASP